MYPEHLISVLREEIKKHGMKLPPTVYRLRRRGFFWFLKRSSYQIVDGGSRVEACRQLGLNRVPCNVVCRNFALAVALVKLR